MNEVIKTELDMKSADMSQLVKDFALALLTRESADRLADRFHKRTMEILESCYRLGFRDSRLTIKQKDLVIRELADAVEFYSHEKTRDGWPLGGIMNGHRFDIACAACNEQGRGIKARLVLQNHKIAIEQARDV